MDRTRIMRHALRLGSLFNFAAAVAVAFPSSPGSLVQLPVPVSPFYSWTLAVLIALFGGAYVWLSRQAALDRPLVVVAIVGKFAVFVVAAVCRTIGAISNLVLLAAVGDLFFGLVFLWWLLGSARERPATV
jgi:hypothetical protein